MLSVIMLSVFMLSVFMLSVIMLSVIMLSDIMMSIILLSGIILSCIMLNVVMLIVGLSTLRLWFLKVLHLDRFQKYPQIVDKDRNTKCRSKKFKMPIYGGPNGFPCLIEAIKTFSFISDAMTVGQTTL
jgi:hypothetical protein